MPELPEVEITRRGIEPYLAGTLITGVRVSERRLRWPIPLNLAARVTGRRIARVARRGKYILIDCGANGHAGWLILHLGMSGSLRILDAGTRAQRHEHFDRSRQQLDLLLEPRFSLGLRLQRLFETPESLLELALVHGFRPG